MSLLREGHKRWLGKMNYIDRNNISPLDRKYYKEVRENFKRKNIQEIINDSFADGVNDQKLVSISESSANCNHSYHYFGDQKKRRCVNCNKIED